MWFNTTIGTDIAEAKRFLEQGETVGIPTETVYGLAANALSPEAVLKIFSVKNRPHFDPLIVHVSSANEIEKYTENIPQKAEELMRAFMPGPLTLLLPKKSVIPDLVTSGLDTVAVRVPKHKLTLELLQQLDFPLAAPSANPFGYISPTSAYHVYDQLHGRIPYILDGGTTEVGLESTIVGFENDHAVVYRLGGLSVDDIERITGKAILQLNESSNPKSPGMLKSHYAPKKNLTIRQFNELNIDEIQAENAGAILFNQYIQNSPSPNQILLSAKGDVKEAARNLFAAMRQLDNSNVSVIYTIPFPDTGLGKAINDRLRRAAVGTE
ncbi:MAG: threonylcarbamoyl-AMP synthase [Chitinophagales bacterium]|nr:threonylcarbamoyl-AMP synthase [Chitinophagales bacterium]